MNRHAHPDCGRMASCFGKHSVMYYFFIIQVARWKYTDAASTKDELFRIIPYFDLHMFLMVWTMYR